MTTPDTVSADRAARGVVVMLCPSAGLGGGVERYAAGLESAFHARGVPYLRFSLSGSGASAHQRLLKRTAEALRSSRVDRIVALHRNLLPLAALLAGRARCEITAVCHGNEMWLPRWNMRRQLETVVLRRPSVRVVTASSFTAGTIFTRSPAAVLPPGLSRDWFDTLYVASATAAGRGTPLARVVTTFRLADWRQKGLPELLAAIGMLRAGPVTLSVCGSGEPPPELTKIISHHRFATLNVGLSDAGLAAELASADLFVLATRTVPGRAAYGEGYGLVLAEAQLAGTAVIAPAHGGSHDTFLAGVTGISPATESAGALAIGMDSLLSDRPTLTAMGKKAAEWARERFDPDHYADLALAAVLGASQTREIAN